MERRRSERRRGTLSLVLSLLVSHPYPLTILSVPLSSSLTISLCPSHSLFLPLPSLHLPQLLLDPSLGQHMTLPFLYVVNTSLFGNVSIINSIILYVKSCKPSLQNSRYKVLIVCCIKVCLLTPLSLGATSFILFICQVSSCQDYE